MSRHERYSDRGHHGRFVSHGGALWAGPGAIRNPFRFRRGAPRWHPAGRQSGRSQVEAHFRRSPTGNGRHADGERGSPAQEFFGGCSKWTPGWRSSLS